jgi:hypothetical protein
MREMLIQRRKSRGGNNDRNRVWNIEEDMMN